jgi:hypothetical protein
MMAEHCRKPADAKREVQADSQSGNLSIVGNVENNT